VNFLSAKLIIGDKVINGCQWEMMSRNINTKALLSMWLQLNSASPRREEVPRSGLDEGRQFLASRDGKRLF
jgi:hypothetical protein